tara:strand:+ start:70 stop:687 length:618 start_codon:yes stop_codon:yes gene_type:complete
LKVKLVDLLKNKQKDYNINDDIFSIEPRSDIISRVVRWQLSKKRTGNHKVKSRSEIKSTTAKIYRQKGTGKARHGPPSVVQFRGGGVVHGPLVRDHSHKLPKKIRLLGLKSALSIKARNGNLNILENAEFDNKTKTFKNLLDKLKIDNLLIVIGSEEDKEKLLKIINNIPNIDLIKQLGLNVYDLMKKENVLITEKAIKELEERL